MKKTFCLENELNEDVSNKWKVQVRGLMRTNLSILPLTTVCPWAEIHGVSFSNLAQSLLSVQNKLGISTLTFKTALSFLFPGPRILATEVSWRLLRLLSTKPNPKSFIIINGKIATKRKHPATFKMYGSNTLLTRKYIIYAQPLEMESVRLTYTATKNSKSRLAFA